MNIINIISHLLFYQKLLTLLLKTLTEITEGIQVELAFCAYLQIDLTTEINALDCNNDSIHILDY